MFHNCACVVVVLLALLIVVTQEGAAFQPTGFLSIIHRTEDVVMIGRKSNTALYGLLGRFRKNRKVDQVSTIKVGDKIPDGVDIERVLTSVDGVEEVSEPISIQDVLGPNKALLIGMPGAFTTTCSQVHLPGFVQSAKKLRSLGVDTISVITTNDRFVNQEWGKQQGIVANDNKESAITMLCDADGDFIKSIGLADDMGFGVGIRSKRFAMITDNGVVSALLTDDGMDDCQTTSAASVIKLLTPISAEKSDGAIEIDGKLILGAAGTILVAILASMMGGSGTTTKTAPTRTPNQTNVSPRARPSSETSFSLIDEYLKK